MKNIILLTIVILMVSCSKPKKYSIDGTLTNIPDSTLIDLYRLYPGIGTRVKTDTVYNGKFHFEGTLNTFPAKFDLSMRDYNNFSGKCIIWADYTDIKVTGSSKYLSAWNVESDIPEQEKYQKIKKAIGKYGVIRDSLILLRTNGLKDEQLEKRMDSLFKKISSIEFNVIKENYNSYEAIEILHRIARFSQAPKSEIEEIFNKIDTTYKNTLYGEGIENELKEIKIPKIGDKMVDLAAYDLEGVFHKISDYKGKYILLDFWSVGCYPCKFAAPELRKLQKEYDNLKIVGINLDPNKKLWEEATKRDTITWLNLSDGKATYGGAYIKYGIKGLPTYILIDKNGTILERWEGFSKKLFEEKLIKMIR